jgi:hypothetical protein
MRALPTLALVTLTGCSLVFVREPEHGTLVGANAPITCTTSRALPTTDLALGAIMGALVAAVTYSAVERFNDMCVGECYHAWKPATLAAFLVVSPWWISSAVGYSDTSRCRDAIATSRMR